MKQISDNYESIIAALNRNVAGLKMYPEALDKPEHKYLHPVFDKALFNALCTLDLITELKYLDLANAAKNAWEANFFSRVVAHSCFEILDNFNAIAGREILELVKTRLGPGALKDLHARVREMNQINRKDGPYLKAIRNNLFGHRMKVGLQQAEEMLLIKPAPIYQLGRRIFRIEVDIMGAYMELLKAL